MAGKDNRQSEQAVKIKILRHCTENNKDNIADLNVSFNAMDTKIGIFTSLLLVLTALMVEIASRMEFHTYAHSTRIALYYIGAILLVSIIINLVLTFMTLKGRKMESGTVDHERIDWFRNYSQTELEVLEEIYNKTKMSVKDNEKGYQEKRNRFRAAQSFCVVNIITVLLFMVLLVILGSNNA